MPHAWLMADTRGGCDHYFMLFEAPLARVRSSGKGVMGEAKILAANPGLEGRFVLPGGEDHIGRRDIGGAEHLQTDKARLLVDLSRTGSEALLELLPRCGGDRNTVSDRYILPSLRVAVDERMNVSA